MRVLLGGKGAMLFVSESLASALVGVNPVFRVRPSRKLHSREQDLTAYKSSRVSWLGRFRRVYAPRDGGNCWPHSAARRWRGRSAHAQQPAGNVPRIGISWPGASVSTAGGVYPWAD